jgi:hypothetical protein
MTVSHGNDALGKHVCNVAMNIDMDNTPPFQATCHQGVPILALQAVMTPGTVVAVRVNPQNPQGVALDFDSEPPTVTMSATGPNRGSARRAARHRHTGAGGDHPEPADGYGSQAGVDMYAFVVTILCDGDQPYQTQTGNPVPLSACRSCTRGPTCPPRFAPRSGAR